MYFSFDIVSNARSLSLFLSLSRKCVYILRGGGDGYTRKLNRDGIVAWWAEVERERERGWGWMMKKKREEEQRRVAVATKYCLLEDKITAIAEGRGGGEKRRSVCM